MSAEEGQSIAAGTVFDYYYGDESNQFSFYRIPRQLITGDGFKKLSTDAKLDALEFSLKKADGSNVQAWLEQTLAQFYEQTVPQPLREYLDSRAAPAPRPKRPLRSAPKDRPVAEPHAEQREEGEHDG